MGCYDHSLELRENPGLTDQQMQWWSQKFKQARHLKISLYKGIRQVIYTCLLFYLYTVQFSSIGGSIEALHHKQLRHRIEAPTSFALSKKESLFKHDQDESENNLKHIYHFRVGNMITSHLKIRPENNLKKIFPVIFLYLNNIWQGGTACDRKEKQGWGHPRVSPHL